MTFDIPRTAVWRSKNAWRCKCGCYNREKETECSYCEKEKGEGK